MNKAKTKTIISLIALIIFSAIVVGGIYFYFLKNIQNTSGKILALKKEAAELTAQKQNIGEMRSNFKKSEEEMIVAQKAVVSDGETVKFIEKMEMMARQAGVKLNLQVTPIASTNPKDEQPAKNAYFSEKAFALVVSGSEAAVMSFLYDLQNFEYYLNLQDLSFRAIAPAAANPTSTNSEATRGVEMSAGLILYQSKP